MYKIYKIEAGDTFESVAKKFNTTVDMLKRINGMNEEDNILVSQYLIVPVERGVLFDIYVVQPGDNMYQIAKRYGVKEEELLKLNGLEKNQYIYPNEEILVPRKGVKFYITAEGDTIVSASDKMNISPGQILLQNETIYLLPDQLLVYRDVENKGQM